VSRAVPSSRQAFDNTGHFLVAFSSIAQTYQRSQFLNGYETEDVQEGAWGSATIGRVFSLGNGGQTMWYLGGQAEQSRYVASDLYLFGRIAAGTGFGEGRALYTYLEIAGLGHWRLSDNFLLTSRVTSQTAWNWSAFRQLVLDFESGLRGYAANGLSGDNRIITNSEIRWFPGWKAWIFGFSAVAFYDAGTVWNQGAGLQQTRFHNAVGLGFRFHNLKASGSDAVFRFDFAYNMDTKSFTGLIFNVSQMFSAFGSHKYRIPDVLGSDLDLE
jgi:hemolysin activation/secretion protein